MFLFTFDLTAALSFSFSFQPTILFCFVANFPQQIFECKITQKTLETFSLCAGIGHASVWYTIASLNFHGILMHREREKERQAQRARKRAGRRPSEKPAVFPSSPEFSRKVRLFKSEQIKQVQKKRKANKESHLLKCSIYCSFVRCFTLPSHDTPLSCPL